MSSCPLSLTPEETAAMRETREDQLRELYSRAIVTDLLNIYLSPSAADAENPFDQLLGGLDVMLGVDRKRIFIEVLRGAIPLLEVACGSETGDPVSTR